jgi:hypothetical protein
MRPRLPMRRMRPVMLHTPPIVPPIVPPTALQTALPLVPPIGQSIVPRVARQTTGPSRSSRADTIAER